MCRKITEKAVNAMLCGYDFRESNTEVRTRPHNGTVAMILHGHCIALIDGETLHIYDHGYKTRVTYERLHELVRRWTYGKYGVASRKGGVLIEYERNTGKIKDNREYTGRASFQRGGYVVNLGLTYQQA